MFGLMRVFGFAFARGFGFGAGATYSGSAAAAGSAADDEDAAGSGGAGSGVGDGAVEEASLNIFCIRSFAAASCALGSVVSVWVSMLLNAGRAAATL